MNTEKWKKFDKFKKKIVKKYSPNVYFEAIEKNGKNCHFFNGPIQPLYLPQIFKKHNAKRKILNSFPTESFMCKSAYTLLFNL